MDRVTGLVTSTCSSARDSTNSPPMRRRTLGCRGTRGEVSRGATRPPSTATNQRQREWTGDGNPRVRTGVEAGPSESHAVDAATVENGAAATGDRRRPEAAWGRCQGTRDGGRLTRRRMGLPERKSAARSIGRSIGAAGDRASDWAAGVGRRTGRVRWWSGGVGGLLIGVVFVILYRRRLPGPAWQ